MTGWTGRSASNREGKRRAGNEAYEFFDSRSTEVFAFFSLVFSNLAAKTHLRQFSMNFQWCRVTVTVPIRSNGQKRCNLFCNIAAKQAVEKRWCTFYQPCSNLWTTWFVAREVWCGLQNAQHRYSTRFAAMMQDTLDVFCCPFFRTFKANR